MARGILHRPENRADTNGAAGDIQVQAPVPGSWFRPEPRVTGLWHRGSGVKGTAKPHAVLFRNLYRCAKHAQMGRGWAQVLLTPGEQTDSRLWGRRRDLGPFTGEPGSRAAEGAEVQEAGDKVRVRLKRGLHLTCGGTLALEPRALVANPVHPQARLPSRTHPAP